MALESVPTGKQEEEKKVVYISPEDRAKLDDPETTHVAVTENAMNREQFISGVYNEKNPMDAKYFIEPGMKEKEEAAPRYGEGSVKLYTKAEALEKFNFEAKSE